MPSPSKTALVFILSALVAMRLLSFWFSENAVDSILTWDAFGYYLYLPAEFIYGDWQRLEWLPAILEKYHPTPHLYQTIALPNGHFAMKYLMGLSILYLPFFALGHAAAGLFGYPQDGFSAPYPLAIAVGSLVYAAVAAGLLRRVLLRFFDEKIAATALVLTFLATNFPEYSAIEAGMTHGWLFAIYALQLFLTVRWHDRPTIFGAFWIGAVIGLASITRPTEGVMLFLPLLWRAEGFGKWAFLKKNPSHLAAAFGGGLVGIFPQLLYWKSVTGRWIFDVGSKWFFADPFWRVLFGTEKGWFLYTPVAVLMVAGLFFGRKKPFWTAATVFFLLNAWIIMAWSDWRYGASFSCRALLQGTAVLALPLAVLIEKAFETRLKWPFLTLGIFLIGLNFFQIWQYQTTVLHYDDMNWRYYRAIFLNPAPSPPEMSLLDTDEILEDEMGFSKTVFFDSRDSVFELSKEKAEAVFFEKTLPDNELKKARWLKFSSEVWSDWGAFGAELFVEFSASGMPSKSRAIRLENGICRKQNWNRIEFFFNIPDGENGLFRLGARTNGDQKIRLRGVRAAAFKSSS